MSRSRNSRLEAPCFMSPQAGGLVLGFILVMLAGISAPTTLFAQSAASERNANMSPPDQVDPMDLTRDLAKIDQQWEELERYVRDEGKFRTRVLKVSFWSIGQHVGHIAKASELIAGWIDEILAHPEINAGEPTSDRAIATLESGVFSRGVAKAPPGTTFPVSVKTETVEAELRKARRRWDSLAARAEEMAAVAGKFQHFAYGPVTSAQLARNNAIHTAHHLSIIGDIIAAAPHSQSETCDDAPPESMLIKELVAAFNSKDIDAIMGFFTSDAVYHNMPSDPINGAEAIRRSIEAYVNPAQSLDWEIINIAQTGSTVLTERIDRFEVNGKSIRLPVMGAFDVLDGKIVAWRDYFDLATWGRQMAD